MNRKNLDIINLYNKGNSKIVRQPLRLGVEVNILDRKGYSALHRAIINGHLKLTEYLIKNGANIELKTRRGLRPIELAIYCKRNKILEMFLDLYDRKKKSLILHVSASVNNTKILKLLIQNGVNINMKDESGRTALHWAAQENSLGSGKILVDEGADINAIDSLGTTPLIITAGEGNYEFAQFLIKKGAKVNFRTRFGDTALHLACAWNKIRLVRLLIKNKAILNIKDGEGQTPLHLAAINCCSDAIRLLVKKRARLNLKDNNDKIPFDLAKDCNFEVKKTLIP